MSTLKKKKKNVVRDVSQTPQHSSCDNDSKKSYRQEPPSWSNIPAIALRKIYQSLDDEDRASMARVNKSWYEGYRDPALWRVRIIAFNEQREEEDIDAGSSKSEAERPLANECAISFASSLAPYLQELEIHINQSLRSSTDVIGDFMEFAHLLDVANLTKVHILFYDDDMFEGQRSENFIKVINRLIRNQHNLKRFDIDLAFFEPEHGIKLLKCLAEASGRTLETLFLNNVFVDTVDIYREYRIVTELKKFTNLHEIHIDYALVADELIQLWSRECPTLEYIKLWAIPQNNIIRNDSWKTLVKTHPELLVELHAYDHLDTEITPAILTSAMPVYDLTWDTLFGFTSEVELTNFFRRVASYHKTIERIFLMFGVEFEIPETFSVHNILSNCSNLLPYKFENRIPNSRVWMLSQDPRRLTQDII
ncbi:unnamed protein product [Lymnaea stagnalis]|uniref:F-box domain-containing protein n=1 Tax=Lymnaea stagnalis TaxID=6523 RepID=A0AAV2HK54_LYMST